jgi:hypothetical protein
MIGRRRSRLNPCHTDSDSASRPRFTAPTPQETENIPRRGQKAFFVAILLGFAFGGTDQYLRTLRCLTTLGPWTTTVSGMSAPWLLLPFAFGLTQTRPRRAMLLGLVATMAALAGYFTLMWSPLEGAKSSEILAHLPTWLRTQQTNIAGGLVTGPLFGLLGQRWRVARSWASAALIAGAFCLEPLARWASGRLWGPSLVWKIEVASGAGLALFFLVAGMTRSGEIAKQTTTRP